MHERCSGVHGSLTRQILLAKNASLVLFQDDNKMINLDGDNIDRFFYLVDVLSTEGGAQEAVTSRIRSVWRKFRGFECYMRKKHIIEG